MRQSLFKKEYPQLHSCTRLNVKSMFLLMLRYSPVTPKQNQAQRKEPYILVLTQLCDFGQKKSFVLALNFRFLLCKTGTMLCKWQNWRPDQYPTSFHENPLICPLQITGNWGKQNFKNVITVQGNMCHRGAWRVIYKEDTEQGFLGTQYL